MRVLSKVVTELNLGQWQQLFRLQGMGSLAQLHAGMLFLVSDTPLPPSSSLPARVAWPVEVTGLGTGWERLALGGGKWGGSDQPQQKQAPWATAASSLLSQVAFCWWLDPIYVTWLGFPYSVDGPGESSWIGDRLRK